MTTTLDVHIGEVKISQNGETLKAILGSCVGIALIWESRSKCGLAHCLLPKQPQPSDKIGARYVDQAFQSLVELMKISAIDAPKVRVVVVGGGNMTGGNNKKRLVGASNFESAMAEVKSRGFRLLHSDGGGTLGRKIVVDGTKLSFNVESIPRISSLN